MRHFKDILELQEYLHNTDQRSFLSSLWGQLYPGWYTWVSSSRLQGRAGKIVPLDLGAYLYRGQVQRYQPCLPNLFRKIELDKLIWLLKIEEFRLLCLTHPGVQKCIKFGLHVDFIGLAQHYGLFTNYLDLTQHIDIACFFAVSVLNENGLYEPYKSNGQGIIYRIRHTNPELIDRIVLIGKQPFLRPEKQKAWAFEMKELEDFEQFNNGIEIFIFDHTDKGSDKVWQQFEQQLYPHDIVAEKAKEILESKIIYETIFSKNFATFLKEYTNGALSIEHFHKYISKNGLRLCKKPNAAFSTEELRSLSSHWEKYGESFFHKVGAIGCSEGI